MFFTLALKRSATAAIAVTALSLLAAPSHANRTDKLKLDRMSAMGRFAHAQVTKLHANKVKANAQYNPNKIVNSIGDDDGGYDDNNLGATNSETSIAVDSSGQHVVVGFNDFRGVFNPVLSVSGYMYSDDGGATFTDGGQLFDSVGANPQGIDGDPDIKYCGGSNFAYASILINTSGYQTMCVHVSTDYGHTWQGPYEVTPATDPNSLGDAADKEYIDYNISTGRLLFSWTNFTNLYPNNTEIRTTTCDNLFSGTPTFAPSTVVGASLIDGQASCPRFGPGNTAYIVWEQFTDNFGYFGNTGFSRSSDGGQTWSPEISLAGTNYFTADLILGNDRSHDFPSLAVDKSGGPNNGNLYVVYEENNNHDGDDIAFQRSTDGGLTWSAPATLNSRPGADGPQWFAWVSCDRTTGRVNVTYYDQGNQKGDLTDETYTYSDDGGVTFKAPSPLNNRPFHGGFGNDTSQPNLGDYNQSDSQSGKMYAVFAATPAHVNFDDGEPALVYFTAVDPVVNVMTGSNAALRLGNVSFTVQQTAGEIGANNTVKINLPLQSYAPGWGGFTHVKGTISSSTPGVSISNATTSYPNIGAGATMMQNGNYIITTGPSFVPGTFITLQLNVTSDQGSTTLLTDLTTGHGVGTVFFSENFNSVTPGTLPAGWANSFVSGYNNVPWTTSSTRLYAGGNNSLFHQNAEDGPLYGYGIRYQRVFAPTLVIPANDYITLDFDVAYNLEDDPNYNVLAFDGMTVRLWDATPGIKQNRRVLMEACGDEFTTGGVPHMPKHLPRNNSSAYFQDMSVWSGKSGGYKHVHGKFYNTAGRTLRLCFEYTQDYAGTGLDTHPEVGDAGVNVDNVVMTAYTNTQPAKK